ncbi:hypothetical protein VP1G_09665 [Cytospora mali]|uniref:Uncharacterized protein n=1 Tax=Cytospora mali TaxID=578113 RepID=A0A194VEX2_CYTMA|nr:hypothetical protein VP1G_09665 [Valsa mali var. pyri (nom. inval.)]
MNLPHLSDTPRRYPDFCLSISTRLIHALTDILSSASSTQGGQHENLVLSVGSGSGLLEAHMQSLWSSLPGCNLAIEGVEVRTAEEARPVNRYLSEEHYTTVRGTFEISPRGQEASALIFVYPREPVLIQRYLQAAREDEDSPLRTVVWLGPKADWDTFAYCLRDVPGFCSVEIPQDCGVVEYEMMVVIRRFPGP